MMCNNCGNQTVKYLVMTAIGQRAFCSENCYCIYVDLPYYNEGHYGLNEYDEKDVERLE
jgi:hypothetical protein